MAEQSDPRPNIGDEKSVRQRERDRVCEMAETAEQREERLARWRERNRVCKMAKKQPSKARRD